MKYFGEFKEFADIKGWADDKLRDEDVILARYDCPEYEGYAWCVFRRDGKIYECHDSHCSCYGLENWEPEETSIDAILIRPEVQKCEEYLALLQESLPN